MKKAWRALWQYLRGVRAEFGKVSWPNKQQFWRNFLTVIISVLIVALIAGAFDKLLELILSKTILS
jgi:preprotein translocase SecE subunit